MLPYFSELRIGRRAIVSVSAGGILADSHPDAGSYNIGLLI